MKKAPQFLLMAGNIGKFWGLLFGDTLQVFFMLI
jgi:hypothetical protein